MGNIRGAKETFGRIATMTSIHPLRTSVGRADTLYYLSQIHEDLAEIDLAMRCLEERLKLKLETHRADHAEMIGCLHTLLRFCQPNALHDEVALCKERYAGLYDSFEKITETLWNIRLEDDLGVAADNAFPEL